MCDTNQHLIEINTSEANTEQLLSILQVQGDEGGQGVPIQLVQSGEGEVQEGLILQQSIDVNGERHVILHQAQDPNTNELLVVLQGENGETIALPPEALSSGLVQMTQEGDNQVLRLALPSENENMVVVSQPETAVSSVANVSGQSSPTSTVIQIPVQTTTSSATTTLVHSVDTPRIASQLEKVSLVENPNTESDKAKDSNGSKTERTSDETTNVEKNIITEMAKSLEMESQSLQNELSKEDLSKKTIQPQSPVSYGSAVIQVQDSSSAPLEQLVASAVVSGGDNNYVIMATNEDGALPTEIDLSEVLGSQSSGQTFFLQTSEGLVAYTAASTSQDGSIQLIADGTGTVLTQEAQPSSQGIQTGQTLAYALSSTATGIELTPVTQLASSIPKNQSRAKSSRSKQVKGVVGQTPVGETILLPVTRPLSSTAVRKRTTSTRSKMGVSVTVAPVSSASPIIPVQPDAIYTSNSELLNQTKQNENTTNSSLVTGNISGVSQLAASRRTYSKKNNIVWVNPDQASITTTTTKSTAESSTKVPELKENTSIPVKVASTVKSPLKSPIKSPVKSPAKSPVKSPIKVVDNSVTGESSTVTLELVPQPETNAKGATVSTNDTPVTLSVSREVTSPLKTLGSPSTQKTILFDSKLSPKPVNIIVSNVEESKNEILKSPIRIMSSKRIETPKKAENLNKPTEKTEETKVIESPQIGSPKKVELKKVDIQRKAETPKKIEPIETIKNIEQKDKVQDISNLEQVSADVSDKAMKTLEISKNDISNAKNENEKVPSPTPSPMESSENSKKVEESAKEKVEEKKERDTRSKRKSRLDSINRDFGDDKLEIGEKEIVEKKNIKEDIEDKSKTRSKTRAEAKKKLENEATVEILTEIGPDVNDKRVSVDKSKTIETKELVKPEKDSRRSSPLSPKKSNEEGNEAKAAESKLLASKIADGKREKSKDSETNLPKSRRDINRNAKAETPKTNSEGSVTRSESKKESEEKKEEISKEKQLKIDKTSKMRSERNKELQSKSENEKLESNKVSEKLEKGKKKEKIETVEKVGKPLRSEKTLKADKLEKQEKEKIDTKTSKIEVQKDNEKTSKIEKEKPSKAKLEKSDKSTNDVSEKVSRVEKMSKSTRQEKVEKIKQEKMKNEEEAKAGKHSRYEKNSEKVDKSGKEKIDKAAKEKPDKGKSRVWIENRKESNEEEMPRRRTRPSILKQDVEKEVKESERKRKDVKERISLRQDHSSNDEIVSSNVTKDKQMDKGKTKVESQRKKRKLDTPSKTENKVEFDLTNTDDIDSGTRRTSLANKRKSEVLTPILKSSQKSSTIEPSKKDKTSILPTIEVVNYGPEIDEETERNELRKSITSLSDLRSAVEFYDVEGEDCSFHIRHQTSNLTSFTPRGSGGNYTCQKCGYRTGRMNNLVLHHKDHCPVIKDANRLHWENEINKQKRAADYLGDIIIKKRRMTESTILSTRHDGDHEMDYEYDDDEYEDEENEMEKLKLVRKENETIETEVTSQNKGEFEKKPIKVTEKLLECGSEDDEDAINKVNFKKKYGFEQNEVVWAQFSSLYWPALVVEINDSDKTVSLKFIESPTTKKCVTVDIDEVFPFDDGERNKKFLKDGKIAHGDSIVKAVQKAEDYMRKRCLGDESGAAKLFGTLNVQYVLTTSDEERMDEDRGEEISSPIRGEEKDSLKFTSIESDGNDDYLDFQSSETIAQLKERRRIQNAKLLQCIKEGKVESHLMGVYRETVLSDRHKKFKSGSEAEKTQLKHVPWFGPFDDEDQQEEIYDYCSQLFKANFTPDGNFDAVAYLFEVWVPEAIVKAISRIRTIDMSKAEAIFSKGVILSKSEKDELEKEIMKETEKEISPESSDHQ